MKKKIPIGIDNFEKIISEDYYYIDKSLFIKEILDNGAIATLIPRPRRFGKTLNLSMLKCFFEKTTVPYTHLFDHLAISQHKDAMAHQGKYPVIFMTFKFTDSLNWEECFEKLKCVIAEEYLRHEYLLESSFLKEIQKSNFRQIVSREASKVDYELALKNLITYLADYYQQNPIVLIDEYDVPIHAGFRFNYFQQVSSFIKSFLGDGLKGHYKLKLAVVTGAMRVAKESIFSGLNNLKVCTLLSDIYANKFSLLENEIIEMLNYYDLGLVLDDVRAWYNGYSIGSVTVYNPWSIINLVDNQGTLQPYWINTSNNDVIKTLIKEGDESIKEDIEKLMTAQPITKEIFENIVYTEIKNNNNVLWNFLFYSGYLTFKNRRLIDTVVYADFVIPNKEVAFFFRTTILNWMNEQAGEKEYSQMLKSLVNGDINTFKKLFSEFVFISFSYFDISGTKPEKFYHAFVLGMLVSLAPHYEIKSKRESGYGRYDVMLIPHDPSKLGMIIEFKKVDTYEDETLEQAAANALKQIREKKYVEELKKRGISSTLALAIAFCGKKVLVQQASN